MIKNTKLNAEQNNQRKFLLLQTRSEGNNVLEQESSKEKNFRFLYRTMQIRKKEHKRFQRLFSNDMK